MITLPREPWRGGQICGWQIVYGMPWSRYCGEFKKPGSPLCDMHDEELREEHGGNLPEFPESVALGLAPYRRTTMPYMFTLSWELHEGDRPIKPTPEELAAYTKQLKETE